MPGDVITALLAYHRRADSEPMGQPMQAVDGYRRESLDVLFTARPR
jgi:hypothetical protein